MVDDLTNNRCIIIGTLKESEIVAETARKHDTRQRYSWSTFAA